MERVSKIIFTVNLFHSGQFYKKKNKLSQSNTQIIWLNSLYLLFKKDVIIMFHIDLVYKAYPLNMQSCKNDANLVGSNFIITSDG
jgi:hypothetical protein